jgi:selenocysteine lyase/cysteine desulfurase
MIRLGNDEVAELRKELPALERMTYFTSNGLGVLPLRSAQALAARLRDLSESAIAGTIFGNQPLLVETRSRAARLLGCDPDEVAFSRNTSEGLLWAAEALRWRPGDEVLVARGEYPANLLPWMAQASRGVATRLLAQCEQRTAPRMRSRPTTSPSRRRRGTSRRERATTWASPRSASPSR